MPHPRFTKEEIAVRGREIYAKQLRDKLEADNLGKFLVIDIETGDYEMDADGAAASQRAYTKKPEGVRYGMRIGFKAWGHIGSGGIQAAQ